MLENEWGSRGFVTYGSLVALSSPKEGHWRVLSPKESRQSRPRSSKKQSNKKGSNHGA